MGKFIDITGQKFGRLTVIKKVENKISTKNNRSKIRNGRSRPIICTGNNFLTGRKG